MHEGRGYRYTFQRARVASSPEVPKVTWWKIATILGCHLHWLTSLETSRHFRKIALRLGIFLAMFRECLCVVARQLAPKCRDFSNVAKLARQCKWPLCWVFFNVNVVGKILKYTVINKVQTLQESESRDLWLQKYFWTTICQIYMILELWFYLKLAFHIARKTPYRIKSFFFQRQWQTRLFYYMKKPLNCIFNNVFTVPAIISIFDKV